MIYKITKLSRCGCNLFNWARHAICFMSHTLWPYIHLIALVPHEKQTPSQQLITSFRYLLDITTFRMLLNAYRLNITHASTSVTLPAQTAYIVFEQVQTDNRHPGGCGNKEQPIVSMSTHYHNRPFYRLLFCPCHEIPWFISMYIYLIAPCVFHYLLDIE